MKERIIILGAGESGTGAAMLAKFHGYDVFVSDFGSIAPKYKKKLSESGIAFEEERHTSEKILEADLIIKSPGIPERAMIMQQIRKKGTKVISEIEFAARFTNAGFIAITGTNGKTTTTLLTYHILVNSGFKVGLAGNVGDSLARQVLEDGPDGVQYYVLELSSFQLDDMYDFKADVAILLNITPDHLDRYDNSFENYRDSKFRILNNMTKDDAFIYWYDDDVIKGKIAEIAVAPSELRISAREVGVDAFVNGPEINVQGASIDHEALPLKGTHNHINMMASVMASMFVGAGIHDIRTALGTYKNVPHRMEEVGIINGITFINDSKATNVDSVFYALGAYNSPITWIAGGIDKGNDYEKIRPLVSEKVKNLICLGEDNSKLLEAFGGMFKEIYETTDIKEAARMGYEYSEKNDVVLLSPACASFDLFSNYEDRGDQFRNAVTELMDDIKEKTR
jgi:UDP-N-acetylmuramoylalanine--D-glutamate ligase